MTLNLKRGKWLFEPENKQITSHSVTITTEAGTDLWQRSYYGFRNDNAPALLFESLDNFSFTSKVTFQYRNLFDQCGLIIYLDSENWFKASIEYENNQYSRLGSVVTNRGYSDWATSDINLPSCLWYRLNRRGPDFLIESSLDGVDFRQMRVFHLHELGETTSEMGRADPPLPSEKSVPFGVYACSPLDSSFEALFSDFKLEPCLWKAHPAD
ncbi:MAG: hypothetical protein B6241_13780 [Spirochaetaceae bacterium 4572_59]|nr:MAG: hypothetical protein B6241_13780 [Spirochaetaceae bacterium 4572_59]